MNADGGRYMVAHTTSEPETTAEGEVGRGLWVRRVG